MNRTQSLALLASACLLHLNACDSGSSGGGPPPVPATSVGGSVTSTLGAPLDEYVTLTFIPMVLGAPTEMVTLPDGTYSGTLAPGTYDLLANRPGYEDYEQLGLVFDAGTTTSLDFGMLAMPDNEYIGSANCGVCHESKYDTFQRSGHPFKLNEIHDGVMPTYPFTSLAGALEMIGDDDSHPDDPSPGTDNSAGTPLSYDDVSYVIGGYRWKARFTDFDGFIVTGSEVQYNYFTSAMSGYHDNEVDKPYNCGNCHTTGWKHFDPVLNPGRQGNLAGMDGTFALDGVHCESCHGAGSKHAVTKNSAFITEVASPRTTADFMQPDMAYGMAVSCGECHTRDGERDYGTFLSAFDVARADADMPVLPMGGRIATKGGFIRHHEQYDEILGIDPDDPLLESTRSPAFMSAHGQCTTCHNPHTSTVFRDVSGDAPGLAINCTDCHADKLLTGGMADLDCTDCHMPLLAKSATLTFDPPLGDDRPPLGDVASHIFTVDTWKDPETEQFTADGKFAYPWVTGKYACQRCHSQDGPSFPISFPFFGEIH